MNQETGHILDEQGRLADEKLSAQNLVLTQGGEPTFIPHDTTAPEWNIAALGPEKLTYARRLARELAATQFPGGVILQSFGKLYPGEPLPRWQISVHRSRSGKPLWRDPGKLRLDQESVEPSRAEMPKTFIAELAAALGLRDSSMPAYEDLEANLRATGSDEAIELLPRFCRDSRTFVSRPLPDETSAQWQSFFEPAGWVLPLDHDGTNWHTAEWTLPQGDDLTLYRGDSPIGLRLPLGRLPEDAIRRGLTAEIKEGELLVFLPPLPNFAVFADLVRVIERLVTHLGLPPLRLEGYPPPGDPDLQSIGLTSDPGVLEVNLPPADNWPEFARVVRGLYRSAHAVGMRGYKYQFSGRKVATGGGAHIVLGGPDLDRNPFIRQPKLLSSFLRFLQHHPALSYAFSGLFMGPSSQAPRVDESAFELPYELGITLRALEDMASPGEASQIDALLRNLLMDWNGNTHRAEVSVDKFFNYNAPNGQSGLIEFRAFEMTPEPDMLLAANVLLRALAACFAEQPYTLELIDWREALHDKFALPCFLREDLQDVIGFLNQHGFSFPDNAFDAQLDFRFPVISTFRTGSVQWTLRQALEPWPVMGEHQGTGRTVDSTTDRLELRADGLGADDELVACVNGLRLPMLAARNDRRAGGIRYRLLDNPWGLQPHIKAHTPLRIEIVRRADSTIVHAFEYHNWKPLGEAYNGLPVSEDDAQQRVAERLRPRDDLVGSLASMAELPVSPHAPYTLDLRRHRVK